MVSWQYWDFGMLIPSQNLNCERPIVMAAPDVKPEMTGWPRKLMRNPNLQIAAPNWMIPTKNMATKTKLAYASGHVPARESSDAPNMRLAGSSSS